MSDIGVNVKVTVLTLDYQPECGRDRARIDDFCRDHDVLACHQHFFVAERGPSLALVLEYRDRPTATTTWAFAPPARGGA